MRWCLSILSLVVTSAMSSNAAEQLIVLGDSLSDDGNAFAATGGLFPPDPPYHRGRFSNGPVWVEHLAGALELDNDRIVNFALGGATTGRMNIRVPALGGLLNQRDALLASGAGIDSETLVVIWAGANDLFMIVEGGGDPDEVISAAAENLEHVITSVIQVGARRVVVPNLPDLGKTPEFTAAGAQSLGSRLTRAFNAALSEALAGVEAASGVEVLRVDVERLFREIIEDPEAFGFEDVTESCLASDFSSLCSPQDDHLFWDAVHPTTRGHEEISRRALEEIRIPFFVRGDCNGDGLAGDGPLDALELLVHLFLSDRPASCVAACDVNGDGRLRLSDVLGLLALTFHGEEPVAPFPDCGPAGRATDRILGCESSDPSCR